jgi:serine/threonine protein kinase
VNRPCEVVFMSRPGCPDVHNLQALLDEDGTQRAPDELLRHLETCAGCQQALDTLAAEPAVWDQTAQGLVNPAWEEPALLLLMEQWKRGELPEVPDDDFSILRPAEKPGLLGMLGQYEVQEVIGRGGMGVVLKAFDPALNRVVAIKVIASIVSGSARAGRRFAREARAAAAVCHDHVVTVHGVHEMNGQPYLVMQYVAGESLQARLDRTEPLQVEEIVRIGLQTAQGLAAAHAQGLIHRDVKPANILLQIADCGLRIEQKTALLSEQSALSAPQSAICNPRSAIVKITDFGLARTADDVLLTQHGVVAGTPTYMAPEQARGDAIDHRADLFSLGSVLYALCTGDPPFSGSSAIAVLRQVIDQVPQPIRQRNPLIPVWLEAFIFRLMAKDPAERIQSATETARLLEGFLAHLQLPAVPVPELPSSDDGLDVSEVEMRIGVFRKVLPFLRPGVLFLLLVAGAWFAFVLAGGADDARPGAPMTGLEADGKAGNEPKAEPMPIPVMLALLFGLGIVVGVLVWLGVLLARRYRHRNLSPGEDGSGEDGSAASEVAVSSITFPCPLCGRKLKARESLTGRKVKCSQCSNVTIVPGPGALGTSLQSNKVKWLFRAAVVAVLTASATVAFLLWISVQQYNQSVSDTEQSASSLNPSFGTELMATPGVMLDGVWDREFDRVTGAAYWWTNGAARIVVPLSGPPPGTLHVRLGVPIPKTLKRLCVKINGQSLFDAPVSMPFEWSQMFDLSGMHLGKELIIEVISDTFVPAKLDSRTLGVCVRGFTLLSATQSYNNIPLGIQPVPGVSEEGFHAQEQAIGEFFRWTTGAAKLTVPIRGKPPKILALGLGIPNVPEYRLQVIVNGVKLFDDAVEINRRWIAELPLNQVRLGDRMQIELLSSTHVPAQVVAGSKNTRRLGVNVRKLVLVGDSGSETI